MPPPAPARHAPARWSPGVIHGNAGAVSYILSFSFGLYRGEAAVGVVPAGDSIEGIRRWVTLDMLVTKLDLSIVRRSSSRRHDYWSTLAGRSGSPAGRARRYAAPFDHDHRVDPQLRPMSTGIQVRSPHATLKPALRRPPRPGKRPSSRPGRWRIGTEETCAELYGLTVAAQDIEDVVGQRDDVFAVTPGGPPRAMRGPWTAASRIVVAAVRRTDRP